ncbi:unnamed protein product [Thelazia callipaeda]|uniref:MFS domain-containing protein n=1 Tax=Thelazia callipaeda TaxID=103827 RepID=A0A0N5CZ89_THECL|nr:unnamed protein product [Thelazia callipaeda]
MLYLPHSKQINGLSTIWQEVIISITSGMAGIAALTAGKSSDYFGRRKVILAASAVFITGAIICGAAFGRWTLLLGRILLGIAIGFASMVIPVYISEGAPAKVRGKLVTVYQFMVAFGFTVANAVAAMLAHYDPENIGWRLMLAFAAIPALAQFIGFLYLPETPRYLINHGRENEAQKVLRRLYGNDMKWIDYEMAEVTREMKREAEFRQKNDKFILNSFSKNLIFKILLNIIFKNFCILAVQAVGTIFPLHLIERLGRRVLLLGSLIGVVITLCMMGSAFILINRDSALIDTKQVYQGIDMNSTAIDRTLLDTCAEYRNCDDCVTSEHCGFCSSSLYSFGQCLPVDSENVLHSLYGYCKDGAINATDYAYADNFCKTQFTALPIVIMVLYILVYSFGMGPIPWVFNAEVYPIWARSTCVAMSTFTNWTFNLVMSLTYLTLSQAITKYGAFFLYAGISFTGLIMFYFFMPETRGTRIEDMELLFMSEKARKKHMILLEKEKNQTTNTFTVP